MNFANKFELNFDPIDVIENIFANKFYDMERRSQNEIVIEVQGKWNNMLLFLAWEENMKCLHLSCLINVENKNEDKSKIFELLALANEELWVGHFSYWTEQAMPVFKHSILLNNEDMMIENKVSRLIDIAIKECERMYPVFNIVLNKGMSPKNALYPFEMETIGQA